jgi:Domain of unknown function (DUF4279)
VMNQYEFTLSLQLRHPDIDPVRITEALGIEPQHTWRAGDPRRGAAGEQIEGVYRESYWMGRIMEGPQLSSEGLLVESVLLQTVAQLRRAQSFLEQFKAEEGLAEIHVSLFARDAFTLDLAPDTLTALGRLGLAIAVDVHPHLPQSSPATRAN